MQWVEIILQKSNNGNFASILIIIHNNIIYNIFGDEDLIKNYLNKYKINIYNIIHTNRLNFKDEDSALAAAKKGKNTSMWMAIESVKLKNSDALFQPVIPEHYLLLLN